MSRPESVAGSASTPSHAPRPPAPKSRSMSPSNISLFVSNLKLLNLDQRQDWPDITVRTFDTKDALQNQKKRVAGVEWSLYRLFEIWDRETTRDVSQDLLSRQVSLCLCETEIATVLSTFGTNPIFEPASRTVSVS